MPERSSPCPDKGDPSLSEGRFDDGEGVRPDEDPELSEASVEVRRMARYLTVHPHDADLVRELREGGRERRLQQEPLPLCDEGRGILAELKERRHPQPMVDLMDAPIPTAGEEAGADGVVPPEDEPSDEISIERSGPPRTPPPASGEVPGALQA